MTDKHAEIRKAILRLNTTAANSGPTHNTYMALVKLAELVPAVRPMVAMWNSVSWRIKVVQDAILQAVNEIT